MCTVPTTINHNLRETNKSSNLIIEMQSKHNTCLYYVCQAPNVHNRDSLQSFITSLIQFFPISERNTSINTSFHLVFVHNVHNLIHGEHHYCSGFDPNESTRQTRKYALNESWRCFGNLVEWWLPMRHD